MGKVLRQRAEALGFSYLDNPDWKNVTFTLKTREVSGCESVLNAVAPTFAHTLPPY